MPPAPGGETGVHDEETAITPAPTVRPLAKETLKWGMVRAAFFLKKPSFLGPFVGKEPITEALGPECRGFEIAGLVEAGLAKELPTDFTTPLRRSGKLWRFRLVRSNDRLHSRLMAEGGEFLLYAATDVEGCNVAIHLYDPNRENDKTLFDRAKPAFCLSFNKSHTEWVLTQERCEGCQLAPRHVSCEGHGKQQLVVITHRRKQVGDGVSNIMEVRIPGIYNNGTAVHWCPVAGHGDLRHAQETGHLTQTLLTQAPTWNADVGSLVLDFKGRSITASAKNFQLALRQKPEHILCQFGKLSDSNFGLDFKFPLSVVQAFAVALSTMFWV